MNNNDLYLAVLSKWGTASQIHMAIEECAELIVVLTKHRRNINSTDKYDKNKETFKYNSLILSYI